MERDLVERARCGDHDAFALLVRSRIGRLDRAARLIVRDGDRAEDVVQDTLIRCWRGLPTLRDPERFDAWLERLFLNACRDELRRTRRLRVEVTPVDMDRDRIMGRTPDAQSAVAERDALERGLGRLASDQRTVLVLHYYLGLPLPDAAAAMHIPVGTAKSRLHRATEALRAILDADGRSPQTGGQVA